MLRPVRVLLGFASPDSTLTLEDEFVFFSLIHAVQIFCCCCFLFYFMQEHCNSKTLAGTVGDSPILFTALHLFF